MEDSAGSRGACSNAKKNVGVPAMYCKWDPVPQQEL